MNEIQLLSKSPRCIICKNLVIDKTIHLKEKHSALVFYHFLVQMNKLIKQNQEWRIFK